MSRDSRAALLRRLSHYHNISDFECSHLKRLPAKERRLNRGLPVIAEGSLLGRVMVLDSGWAIRHRSTEDGRRQIINLLLPGDFFDLQVLAARTADHGVTAVTDIWLTELLPSDIIALFEKAPATAAALWWAGVQEEAILREQIVRLGQRAAYPRLCHLLLEIYRRLSLIGAVDEESFEFPLTHALLADLLGISAVHMERTLQRLREDGFVRWQNGRVELLNRRQLRQISGFNDDYLHLEASLADYQRRIQPRYSAINLQR